MQDLKYLTKKKRFSDFVSSRPGQANRRLTDSRDSVTRRSSLLTVKHLRQLRYLALFVAVVLVVTPLCLFLLRKAPAAAGAVAAWFQRHPAQSPRIAEAAKQPAASPFEIASSLLDSTTASGDQLTARTGDGLILHYTIQGALQKRVHDFMADKKVPYGVFVAIEPSTGRILAMTSYSAINPDWERRAFFDLYPMASLFKIVTASAALENKRITPDTVVEFRGRSCSETPQHWNINHRGKNNSLDVSFAMGKSVNPVFGRVAADIAGKSCVMESVNKFGFNQALLPGTPAKESRAAEPQSTLGLMQMGAGLDHEVKISPLHVAVMMASIANGGRMMYPGLTEKIVSPDGTARETHTPRELRRPISPETAASLTRMLSSTVTTGTSRRAFHDRRGRPLLGVDV
ncbi:MAG: penicillin-binding protein, partial [Desulfuromonadales bacterium]|nr:penicillin-binding protein [Desulfuromonadales bacterium]